MTQPIIKILLLVCIAVVALSAFRGSDRALHRAVWRGYFVLVLAAAVTTVLFPGALTWVATKVGVGRGADLLLYVLAITVMLVGVIVFRRLAELERRYVELARALALQEAAARGASQATTQATSQARTDGD